MLLVNIPNDRPLFDSFYTQWPPILARSVTGKYFWGAFIFPDFFPGVKCSNVASPICQEGQSERTFLILAFSEFWFFLDFFPIFPLFLPIFDNFFAVKGALCPLLPLYWLRHWWKAFSL